MKILQTFLSIGFCALLLAFSSTRVPAQSFYEVEGVIYGPNTTPRRFSADVRLTRPVKIMERVSIEPYLEVFNLFNNTPKGTYGGLRHRVFGNLNYPYTPAELGDLDGLVRGLLQNPRQAQFGIRFIF
jgi:hypothetical protein